MIDYMVMPLRRYADFAGRSRRKEYWLFTLFVIIVYILIGALFGGFGTMAAGSGDAGFGGVLLLLFGLAIVVPSIAVTVRRFHDQNKSGWFILLGLIPFVGGIIVFVFMVMEGTHGDNRFGPDPKTGEARSGS